MRKFAIFAAAVLFATGPARASLIQVEPDLFPVGSDIRLAFPGVTLSVASQPSTLVVPAVGTSVFLGGANIATTGERVFARSPAGDCRFSETVIVDTAKTWSDLATCGLLRADFDVVTDLVSIDVIFDDDDIGILSAFDGAGNLLAEVSGAGDGRGPIPFQTLTISRATRDIAYIVTGGFSSEGIYLDNLRFDQCSPFPGGGSTGGCFPGPGPFPATEPTTLALLGLAFAGLGFARRRKQH